MKKKSIAYYLLTIMFVLLFLSGCSSEEKKVAEEAFTKETARLTEQFAKRDAAIADAQAIIDGGEKAYVESLIPSLETEISSAKAVDIVIPEMPKKLEELKAETEKLKAVDCTESLANLAVAKENAELSIQREKLVTAPKEAYIIERLKTVVLVKDIAAATETNDPNGNLNKQGGYTAQVFFSCPWVNQADVYGDSLVEKGTDAGGSIEVYRTEEEVNNRETYLSAFDGGILASGSHKTIGTILVRTSDTLTASQQKELESKLIQALIHLDIDDAIANTEVSNGSDGWGVYKDGKLDETYNGIATNNMGQWLIKDGKVSFDYSGEFTYAGLIYTVEGGKVQVDTAYTNTEASADATVESNASSKQDSTTTQTTANSSNAETTTASTTSATTTNTTRAVTRTTVATTAASTTATMSASMAPTIGEG